MCQSYYLYFDYEPFNLSEEFMELCLIFLIIMRGQISHVAKNIISLTISKLKEDANNCSQLFIYIIQLLFKY